MDETLSQHEVEVFLEAAREDQQQPEEPELGSSPEKEAGSPIVSVEEEQAHHQGDANRDTESNDAGATIGSQRGEGDQASGEKPRGGGSSEGGEWIGADRGFRPAWLIILTLVHEAWLCLQHANVLLNPLCQRLDRGYGVALVRKQFGIVLGGISETLLSNFVRGVVLIRSSA